jgi:hypothetical protein
VSATASFFCEATGLPSGTKTVSVSWTVSSPVGQTTDVDLSSGANTISVPTGTTLVIIVPPTTNTQTLTLKGVTGDTGVQLKKTKPTILAWQTGSSFVLTAGASIAGVEISFL